MTTMNDELVISERIPRARVDEFKPALEAKLHKLASGLEVSAQFANLTSNRFVKITLTGSDVEVFTELVKRKLGLAPTDLSEIEVNDNFKAYVNKVDLKQQVVDVEIGPISANLKSEVSRGGLTAQLSDGRSVPVETIARTYCMDEDVPILVRIVSVDHEHRHIEAWLSDDQTGRFEEWRRERFHRIIAVGGFHEEIARAVRHSKTQGDVIDIQELALTAHVLVCKLGTDGPGIIAKIGRHASNFRLHAFLPQKVDKLRFAPAEPQETTHHKRLSS